MSTCETTEIETEIIDGYRIDSRTGEVLEYVGRPEFHIDSDDKAEWVLERRGEIEADLAAVRARREAILANLDALERKHAGRLRALVYRFESELEAFTRSKLAGGKAKTWRCPYGTVAIRKVPARWTWADVSDAKEKAIEWAEQHCPDAIKTKVEHRVALDDLVPVAALHCSHDGAEIVDYTEVARFPSWVPEAEKVHIKTGVKA